MIKTIKINENIYQNIEPYIMDENGNQVPFDPIFEDFAALQAATIDTLNWLIGDSVKRAIGNEFNKLSAANSKAVVLLAKVVNEMATANTFTPTLTADEQAAYDKLIALADNGYADSTLLNVTLDAIVANITSYSNLIAQAQNATTIDELIAILEQA